MLRLASMTGQGCRLVVAAASGYANDSKNKETLHGPGQIRGRHRRQGRPFTGAEYLESLRDGREVYVYGERVKDVTTHPAFRNAARSIAGFTMRCTPRRPRAS